MQISCSATVKDKREHKKLIESLNNLKLTPEVHAQTIIVEWHGTNCEGNELLQTLVNLFELCPEHSVYYSTI